MTKTCKEQTLPVYSCFKKGCLSNREKVYAKMSKVIMGNGSFCSCLIEPQGVSAW